MIGLSCFKPLEGEFVIPLLNSRPGSHQGSVLRCLSCCLAAYPREKNRRAGSGKNRQTNLLHLQLSLIGMTT